MVKKGKVVLVHPMKEYRRSGSTAPLILNLGTWWGWVVNSTSRPLPPPPPRNGPRYPLDLRLGGPRADMDVLVGNQIPPTVIRTLVRPFRRLVAIRGILINSNRRTAVISDVYWSVCELVVGSRNRFSQR